MHLWTMETQFNYQDTFSERSPDAYETLLWDVAWRLLMPVLEVWAVAPPSDFPNYVGTWEPETHAGTDRPTGT